MGEVPLYVESDVSDFGVRWDLPVNTANVDVSLRILVYLVIYDSG